MSSPAKIKSARANGAKSRGPVTGAGRAKSSRNAVKYGLTAKTVVLPSENPDEYEAKRDAYIRELQPVGEVERDLVEVMTAANWRLHRVWSIEAQLIANRVEQNRDAHNEDYDHLDEDAHLALTLPLMDQTLEQFARAEARFERAYSRALKNLLTLQRLRKAAPAPAAPPLDRPEIATHANSQNEPNWPIPTPFPASQNAPAQPIPADFNAISADARRQQASRP